MKILLGLSKGHLTPVWLHSTITEFLWHAVHDNKPKSTFSTKVALRLWMGDWRDGGDGGDGGGLWGEGSRE